jgi:signal peptidase II
MKQSWSKDRENKGTEMSERVVGKKRKWEWAPPRQWLAAGIVAAGVIITDQVSKLLIVNNIGLHESVTIIDPLLRFTYAQNHQGIFSLNYGPSFVYVVSSLFVICFVAIFFLLQRQTRFVTFLMGMILGGGLSNNLIDRIRLGYVIDWIDMGVRNWRFWGIYNIADASIVIPVILFLVYELLFSKKGGKK